MDAEASPTVIDPLLEKLVGAEQQRPLGEVGGSSSNHRPRLASASNEHNEELASTIGRDGRHRVPGEANWSFDIRKPQKRKRGF